MLRQAGAAHGQGVATGVLMGDDDDEGHGLSDAGLREQVGPPVFERQPGRCLLDHPQGDPARCGSPR